MKRLKLTLAIVISAALLSFAVFFTYNLVQGTNGKRMLPSLKQELSAVAIPDSDRVFKEYELYKSTHALVGRALWSEARWDDLRQFYIAQLQTLGWKHVASSNLKEWRKDVGSKAETFKKGNYTAELYYRGPSSRNDWTYTLDISRNVPLFRN